MSMMRRWGLFCLFGALFSVAAARASGGEGGPAGPAAHGAPAAAAGHGAAGGHGAAAEGEGHAAGAHHADYRGDADHDGTANWMDPESGDYMVPKLGFHTINLVLLIGFLVVFAGPGIRDAVRANALMVSRSLTEAAKLKADAAAHHEAVSKRLDALAAEIATMETRARAEAEAEEQRIRARAEDTAARITESAQRQIRDEANRARQALRKDSVELALQLAESILRSQVGAEDQRRLAQEFVDTISAEGVTHV